MDVTTLPIGRRRSFSRSLNRHRAASLPPTLKKTPSTCPSVPRDALQCPICFDMLCFPVTLPCGHNFDRGCLLTAWTHETTESTSHMCPLCRHRTPIDDLHVNLLLQQLIATQFPMETAALEHDTSKCRAMPIHGNPPAVNSGEHHHRSWRTAASFLYFWLASVTEPPGFVLAVLLLMSLLAMALTPQQMLTNASTLPTLFEGLDTILNAFLLLVREIAARLEMLDLPTWPCVQIFAYLL